MRTFPVLLALSFTLTATSAWALPNDWYGTIQFTKTLNKEMTEVYPPGHDYHPGTRTRTETTTWSGTLRLMPGRRQTLANFTIRIRDDRKTDKTFYCPWKDTQTAYHDYELITQDTDVATNLVQTSRLNFMVQPDGTYQASSFNIVGGPNTRGATKHNVRREFYNECSEPHLQVHEQPTTDSANMDYVGIKHLAGTAAPGAQNLTGSWSGKDEDGGDLSYTWDLTLAEPSLSAIIAPTGAIKRGETVTLDASPSIGRIAKYEWTFNPEGECMMSPAGMELKLEGKTVSFKALCDFKAHLRVAHESGEAANASAVVLVQERENWKTTFSRAAGAPFSAPMFADQLHFGTNQCALHASGDVTGHMIHTDAQNNRTWRDSGYELTQLQDSGPFQSMWYVQSQTLKVNRLERVNSELLSGGAVYRLNEAKRNLQNLRALTGQVQEHEKIHSELLYDELQQRGQEGDPAHQIEKVVGFVEEDTQFQADFKVREVETALQEATSDERVKERLRGKGFTGEVSLWLPTRPEFSGGPSGEYLKALGPLWNIGH